MGFMFSMSTNIAKLYESVNSQAIYSFSYDGSEMNESENLAKLFMSVSNRAAFARLYKLNATMILQHIRGDRPISLEYAKAYARAFNLSLKEISPSNYEKIKDLKVDESELNNFVIENNSISVPLLSATGSMGNGNLNHDADMVIDVLRLTKNWIDKTMPSVSSVSNLRFIHAMGDSMSPTFNDGDILLVDSGIHDVVIDGVYVLQAHDRLFIKRVRRRIDGEYEISSDNSSVKTVDILNGQHEVQVKGRVVWLWNGRRV